MVFLPFNSLNSKPFQTKKMKNFIIMLCLALGLVSCTKEELPQAQVVTYDIDCRSCLVYVDDNNRDQQHFMVSGKWQYKFDNSKLDSVKLKIYTSVFMVQQRIKASIKTSDKKEAKLDRMFGLSPTNFQNRDLLDTTIVLKLK